MICCGNDISINLPFSQIAQNVISTGVTFMVFW